MRSVTELKNDFPAGVLTGEAVNQVFALAKDQQFALPAANCIGSNSMNAVMETAGKLNSPVIVQFSTSGSAFVGGKNVPLECHSVSIPAVGMNDGFNTLLVHKNTASQVTHSHHTIVHVRDNDCINTSFYSTCIGNQL